MNAFHHAIIFLNSDFVFEHFTSKQVSSGRSGRRNVHHSSRAHFQFNVPVSSAEMAPSFPAVLSGSQKGRARGESLGSDGSTCLVRVTVR